MPSVDLVYVGGGGCDGLGVFPAITVRRQSLVRIRFYIGNEVKWNTFVYYPNMAYPTGE